VIVTRQRKRRAGIGRIVFPLAVLAALGFGLSWPPSQRAIANGPLKPAWKMGAGVTSVVSRPFTFAAQQQSIADRNRQIRDLTARLERQREATTDAEARVEQLQSQLTAAINEPRVNPLPAPRSMRTAARSAALAPSSAGDRRLAATWAAMEPGNAAAVAQRLPDAEVSRVLAQMDADSAGAIMDALPTRVAARLSRAVAQVSPGGDR
jgi:flagellar motility protein MotE (MotC chaperone)